METSRTLFPEVSVLTSCKQNQAACQVIRQLADRGQHVFDLYCLSFADAEVLRPGITRDGGDPIARLLAEPDFDEILHQYLLRCWHLCQRRECATLPVGELAVRLTSAGVQGRQFVDDGIRIAAIATYLPNLSHPDESLRSVAERALVNTSRLAARLRASCVEIVGGPRFLTHRSHLENSFEPGVTERRFAELSSALANVIGEIPRSVGIALEMEPGPVMLLRELKDIQRVLDLVDRGKDSRNVNIGINVDIGHFSSHQLHDAAIPDALRSDAVIKRVMGFHISDMRALHFADVAPPLWHDHTYFAKWVDYFLQIVGSDETNRSPFFTGTLAVELEAVASLDDVLASVHRTRGWIVDRAIRHGTSFGIRRRVAPWPLYRCDHATVVFVDLVGSTEIVSRMEDAKEDVGEFWSCFLMMMTRELQRRGGKLMNFTGDGFAAAFLGHSMQGQDQEQIAQTCAEDALEAIGHIGGSITEFARKLATGFEFKGIRAGVASGPVWHGTLLPGDEEQVTICGKTVIRAARLMELDRGILTDGATKEAAIRFAPCFEESKTEILRGFGTTPYPTWIYRGLFDRKSRDDREPKSTTRTELVEQVAESQ